MTEPTRRSVLKTAGAIVVSFAFDRSDAAARLRLTSRNP